MIFKLDVICDWDSPLEQIVTREDGFFKALKILKKDWEINFYRLGEECIIPHPYLSVIQKETPEAIGKAVLQNKPDAILFFRDFTSPTIEFVRDKGIPIAICLTGGLFRENIEAYNLVFIESESYRQGLEELGIKVIKAFGINTELFKPIKQPKMYDAIFPAVFANWKRHSLFTKALEEKGIACGWMYDDHETECWKVCQEYGTTILPHLSHKAIAYLMNSSRTCVITSDSSGGSQRTVLEAMACNIPVIVMNDSDKCSEYIKECQYSGEIISPDSMSIRAAVGKWKNRKTNAREFIFKNYSAEIYAEKLKKGILSL